MPLYSKALNTNIDNRLQVENKDLSRLLWLQEGVNIQGHTPELLSPFHSTHSIQMSSPLIFLWTTHLEVLNPSSEFEEKNIICASPNFHTWAFSDITYIHLVLRRHDAGARAWISELGTSSFKFQFCYLPSACPWANSMS